MFQDMFQIYIINPYQIEADKLEERFTYSLQNNWRFGLSLNLLAKYRTDLHNLSSLPIKIVKLRQKESNSSKNAYMIKKRIQQPNNRRGSIAGMYRRVVFRLDFHIQHLKFLWFWFLTDATFWCQDEFQTRKLCQSPICRDRVLLLRKFQVVPI